MGVAYLNRKSVSACKQIYDNPAVENGSHFIRSQQDTYLMQSYRTNLNGSTTNRRQQGLRQKM